MASRMKPTSIWKLDEQWVLPFLASWRTFERTLNPAFIFVLRCASCGEWSNEEGDEVKGPRTVLSVKRENCIIGIMCHSCGVTIKFGKNGIALIEDDVPVRFHKYPKTALESPDGKKPKLITSMLKEAKKYLGIE